MKNKIQFGLILILIITSSVLGYFTWHYYQKYESLALSLITEELALKRMTFNDQYVGQAQFLKTEFGTYIALEAFGNTIDSEYTLSGTGQRIFLKVANIHHQFQNENLTTYIESNLTEINVPLYYEEDIAYIDLELIKRLYDVDYFYIESSQSLHLYENNKISKGKIEFKTHKYLKNKEAFIKYETTAQEEAIWILNEEGPFHHIIDSEGFESYVKKNQIKNVEALQVASTKFESKGIQTIKQPLSLTFEVIDQYKDNFKKQATPLSQGIDYVSPTWFNLNIDGIIINSADLSYMSYAKEQNIGVWALFKNNFDPNWTQSLLNSEEFKKKAIAQLLLYAAIYDIEGINLDFENIYITDQHALTTFVGEMSEVLKAYDQVISMDVTRPNGSDNWSKVFDRKALNQFVDYMVLMAYDEHWGSSPISGSVASLPWTEDSITMSLAEIDSDKLILGIPLYVRVWEEEPLKDGKYKKVGSKAITLKILDQWIKERDLVLTLDAVSGQFYTEYFENNHRFRIWVEDDQTLLSRIELSDQYKLPGVATWRRGFERDSTFQMIEDWQND